MCVVFVRNVTDYLPLEFSYYPTEAVSNKLDPAMVDHVSEAISSPTLIIKKRSWFLYHFMDRERPREHCDSTFVGDERQLG